MIEEIIDYYLLFASHHDGLFTQRRLKEAGVKCTIAPTPREASSFCGMSLMMTKENMEMARQVMGEKDLPHQGMVSIPRKSGIWNKTC